MRMQNLARGFGPANRQRGVGQQTDLLQYRSLVPVNMLVGQPAFAELHNHHQRHLDALVRGRNSRQHPRHFLRMREREDDLVQKLKEAFSNDIKETNIIRRGRLEVMVAPEKIKEVAVFLRDTLGFDHPNGVSAVDYNRENRFEIVYHISSMRIKEMRDLVLDLKESVSRTAAKVGSLVSVWLGVENYERESFEMFGIQFDDHPRLEKLFLTDNWDGPPPLRKDIRFPTD